MIRFLLLGYVDSPIRNFIKTRLRGKKRTLTKKGDWKFNHEKKKFWCNYEKITLKWTEKVGVERESFVKKVSRVLQDFIMNQNRKGSWNKSFRWLNLFSSWHGRGPAVFVTARGTILIYIKIYVVPVSEGG